jgi:oxygen-independent coproporphyrinogen-3 oxidase
VISKELLKKYDIPAPRYTSYPTVPYWSDSPTSTEWVESLRRVTSRADATWSMYMHIPFCETLCTFCGCNTTITRNHERGAPYVDTLLREFETYLREVPRLAEKPLRQIHLGGGTPTFLSPQQLTRLINGFSNVPRDSQHFEGSVEVDPRRTTEGHLRALLDVGFNRVSMGVQDFDAEVQRLVHRIQPFEITRDLTQAARAMGYTSVNFDLIYGLPKQTPATMESTIQKTIELKPDRIALYSFALVPWIKPAQRLFKDEDLPVGAEKRALYELSYEMLMNAGYVEIGMDHFALPSDSLAVSQKSGALHRNFMGYTDVRTDILLGLGVSSISETPDCFHQNEKVLPIYERCVAEETIPTFRGHKLNVSDQEHREQILQFMTTGQVELRNEAQEKDVREFLRTLIEDRLITVKDRSLRITDGGKPFLRNACMALDERLRSQKPEARVFSQSL